MTPYLKTIAVGVALYVVGAIAVTASVDPYGMFRPGAVSEETRGPSNDRLATAQTIRFSRPDGIIIGSSRLRLGLQVADVAWPTAVAKAANLSMLGTNIYEIRRTLEFAAQSTKLDVVILGADFYMFNAYYPAPPTFDENRLKPSGFVDDFLAVLLSYDALEASWAKLRRGPPPESSEEPVDYIGRFERTLIHYAANVYLPAPRRTFSFAARSARENSFDHFAAAVEAAGRTGGLVQVVIPPIHAYQLETIRALGLWPMFETWKRCLTQVVASANRAQPKSAPAGVWDFANFDARAEESLPEPGGQMTWWQDSNHMVPARGREISRQVFGGVGDGVFLTPQSIDRHLAEQRFKSEHFALKNPQAKRFVAEAVRQAGRGAVEPLGTHAVEPTMAACPAR